MSEAIEVCSFCGQEKDQLQAIVDGLRVSICEQCIEHCKNLLSGAGRSINLTELRERVQQQPNNPAPFFALGMALHQRFPEAAIESFQRVLVIEPIDPDWEPDAIWELEELLA